MAVLETQPAPQKAPESANAEPRKKLYGREFYESIGSPKYIVAPMVDRSEFVWPTSLVSAHPD
jgi:tRNA-dihydrouridine synthase 1